MLKALNKKFPIFDSGSNDNGGSKNDKKQRKRKKKEKKSNRKRKHNNDNDENPIPTKHESSCSETKQNTMNTSNDVEDEIKDGKHDLEHHDRNSNDNDNPIIQRKRKRTVTDEDNSIMKTNNKKAKKSKKKEKKKKREHNRSAEDSNQATIMMDEKNDEGVNDHHLMQKAESNRSVDKTTPMTNNKKKRKRSARNEDKNNRNNTTNENIDDEIKKGNQRIPKLNILNGLTLAVSTLDVKAKKHESEESSYKAVVSLCRNLGATITGQVHQRVFAVICNQTAVTQMTQRVRKAIKKKLFLLDVEWVRQCQAQSQRLDHKSYILSVDHYHDPNTTIKKQKLQPKMNDNHLEKETEFNQNNDKTCIDISEYSGWTEAVSLDCCCVCHENGDFNCKWCASCNITLARKQAENKGKEK